MSKPDDGEFQLQYFQRKCQNRQRKRAGFVAGKGTSNTLSGAPPPIRDYFVYRVAKDATEDTLKQHLMDMNVPFKDIKKISNDDSKFSSFKLTIPFDEVSKVLDAGTWPAGIQVRKFFSKSLNDSET